MIVQPPICLQCNREMVCNQAVENYIGELERDSDRLRAQLAAVKAAGEEIVSDDFGSYFSDCNRQGHCFTINKAKELLQAVLADLPDVVAMECVAEHFICYTPSSMWGNIRLRPRLQWSANGNGREEYFRLGGPSADGAKFKVYIVREEG